MLERPERGVDDAQRVGLAGRITFAETYAPSAALKQKTTFAPGESFASDVVFVTYHAGDYFAPLDRYTRLLDRVSGRHIQNADARAPAFARGGYWKTWGLDPTESGNFTKQQVRQIATQLPALGIHWFLLDWGWFTAEGNWDPNPDVFTDENDLRAFIAELKASGFHVGLWFQPLQLDPTDQVVNDSLLPYSVKNEDGSEYRDDDDLALADPSLGPVQTYVDAQLARFADLGIEHIYLDSQVAQLAIPPDFALAAPLASHEALPGVYDRMRAFGKQHGMVIEICPDGRSQSILDVPQDVNNIGDPKNDRQLRAEFKSLKAILGPRAIVGAYVDPFPELRTKVRLDRACRQLATTREKLSTIATDVGFASASRFTIWFGRCLGVRPSEFRSLAAQRKLDG